MQFPTSRYITDRQSVILGVRKVRNTYRKALKTFVFDDNVYFIDNATFYDPVISKYNGGTAYKEAIGKLTEVILSKYYPNTIDSLVPPEMARKVAERYNSGVAE